MSLITDIPERDGKDGVAQLALLRSYLKDTVADYKYTDELLIDLLVLNPSTVVWANITGNSQLITPWSYDPLKIEEPVNKLRYLIGDTDELSLEYTDAELLNMLDVIPLRYVITMINSKAANGTTYPSDINNPIHIYRKFMGDTNLLAAKNTDSEIVDIIISSCLSPYGVILENLNNILAESSSNEITTGGSEFVSVDGISFSNPTDQSSQKEYNLQSVMTSYRNSVYWKIDTYFWYEDGTDVAARVWEARWYGV